MEEKQCLHVKNIRQITQGDEKPTNTQSNSKRENDKRNMKQAWVTTTKGKRTEIGKAPDWKKKKKRRFSVIVVLQVFPSISDLLLFRKEQAGL